ncbi:MAG: aspartyl protease family protein [Cyclobacteriaceae bacterium]|nr:aspartyl protease family protein [Cyclobacteriaceae bacterium]
MRYLIAVSLFFLTVLQSLAQTPIGLILPDNESKVTLEFKLVNNLIVIPITINNRVTLKFILDTGANSPILTERLFGDIMGLKYDRTIFISGPGIIDSIGAYVASNIRLSMPNGIHGRHMSMLVLEEDYIELKKNLGEDIFGIIGYDVFSRFVVEINYDQLEVTFHKPDTFKPRRRLRVIDMPVEGTKPYINAVIKNKEAVDTIRLMIDTGASHTLLLDIAMSENLDYPDTVINTTLGHGLGGAIPGSIGRFDQLSLAEFTLDDILVSIPNPGVYSNAIKRGSRNGTIGGNTLTRFNPIMDYQNEKLYLEKSINYKYPINYDMSGMSLSYLENPNRLEVAHILPDSPAAETDLRVGDVIHSINGNTLNNSTLSKIYGLLRSKEKKKINVIVLRNNEKVEYNFRLRKLI